MKLTLTRTYFNCLEKEKENRIKQKIKTDLLMRATQYYPEIKKGYFEFKNGFDEYGQPFIQMELIILKEEE